MERITRWASYMENMATAETGYMISNAHLAGGRFLLGL